MLSKKELMERLESIKDSLSDTDNRWGIEGVIDDIAQLMNEVDEGIKEELPDIDVDVSAEHEINKYRVGGA